MSDTELPKVYHLNLSQNQLDIVGSSAAFAAARQSGDLFMYLRMTHQIQVVIDHMGEQVFMEEYTGLIDQIAKLQGLTECPSCGQYHQEAHRESGDDPKVN